MPHFRPLATPEDEAKAFGRMRFRLLTTLLRQTLAESRFRVALVVVLTTSLWGGMFWMFTSGFGFLKSAIPQSDYGRMVGAMFGTFFAALMLMLVFSSGIILYSSLFSSRESTFLLTIPARTERIFLHKFQEAVLLSSWGFVLLGSPILLAYGVVERAPWYYYVLLLPYLVAFIYIPVAVGAIICLWVVYRIPDNRMAVLIGGVVVLAVGAIWLAWSLLSDPKGDMLTPAWFRDMMSRMQFTERRLLPHWWLSSGLLAAASGNRPDTVLFLTLMVSNALILRQLALWTASRIYRPGYSSLYGKLLRRRRSRPARFDRLFSRAIGFLPAAMRLMVVKDFRLFRRDPLQWSQFLIFLGLLALYFFNIRRFTYHTDYAGWMNMVSFLNLSVVGLLLSTFTTRFVFPMISLEGRRFWILGLLPVHRDRILWSKFLFATGGSLIPFTILVLLSDAMLNVSKLVMFSHQLTCVVLCLGLSGIAVGLGARLPNLREQSPSRIAAGFGGTLNLVVSTLYILAVVLLTALPTHFYLATQYAGATVGADHQSSLQWWVALWWIVGTVASFILGIAATLLPMRMGIRAFRKMEF
jgi:ABC-2 type transport system permease protein